MQIMLQLTSHLIDQVAIKEIIKKESPDLIILDDGYQDKKIKKR